MSIAPAASPASFAYGRHLEAFGAASVEPARNEMELNVKFDLAQDFDGAYLAASALRDSLHGANLIVQGLNGERVNPAALDTTYSPADFARFFERHPAVVSASPVIGRSGPGPETMMHVFTKTSEDARVFGEMFRPTIDGSRIGLVVSSVER